MKERYIFTKSLSETILKDFELVSDVCKTPNLLFQFPSIVLQLIFCFTICLVYSRSTNYLDQLIFDFKSISQKNLDTMSVTLSLLLTNES